MHKRLKQMRMEANMKASELADQLAVDPTLISKWENGKTEPALQYIKKYSEIFDRSIDWIAKGESDLKNMRVVKSKQQTLPTLDTAKMVEELSDSLSKRTNELIDKNVKDAFEKHSKAMNSSTEVTKGSWKKDYVFENDIFVCGEDMSEIIKRAKTTWNKMTKTILFNIIFWYVLISIFTFFYPTEDAFIVMTILTAIILLTYFICIKFDKINKYFGAWNNSSKGKNTYNNMANLDWVKHKIKPGEFKPEDIGASLMDKERKKLLRKGKNYFLERYITCIWATALMNIPVIPMMIYLEEYSYWLIIMLYFFSSAGFFMWIKTSDPISAVWIQVYKKSVTKYGGHLEAYDEHVIIPANSFNGSIINFIEVGYRAIEVAESIPTFNDLYSILMIRLLNKVTFKISMPRNWSLLFAKQINNKISNL